MKHQRGHTKDKGVTNLFKQNTKDREARSTHEEDSVKVEDVDVDCEIFVNGNPMMPTDLERDSFSLIMYQDPNLYPFEGQDQMLIFHSMWPKNDRFIDIKVSAEKQRRRYEGHNTHLGYYTDQRLWGHCQYDGKGVYCDCL